MTSNIVILSFVNLKKIELFVYVHVRHLRILKLVKNLFSFLTDP